MKLNIKIICFILCALVAFPTLAQGNRTSIASNVFSVYAKGGASMATGVDFQNVNPSMGINFSPEVGGGVAYEFVNGIRLGANYQFSKLRREQRLSQLEPTAPRLDKPGATYEGGTAYREFWSHFNNADISFEYNFSTLMPAAKAAGVNLYLGTGFGFAFVSGNQYEISMAYEYWEDPNNIQDGKVVGDSWISQSWLSATNTKHSYKAPYIPANLSVEFDISKHFSLGVKCDYKFFVAKENLAPKGLLTAGGVLRLKFPH